MDVQLPKGFAAEPCNGMGEPLQEWHIQILARLLYSTHTITMYCEKPEHVHLHDKGCLD